MDKKPYFAEIFSQPTCREKGLTHENKEAYGIKKILCVLFLLE